MKTLEEIVMTAKSTFQNRLRIEDPANIEEIAHEIAKNSIPSSSKEILLLALRNLELALEVPTKGPAFDGKQTGINLVAANIREKVFHSLLSPQEIKTNVQIIHDDLMRQLDSLHESFYTENLYQRIPGSRGDS